MVKKITGIVVALAVIAVIVLAIVHHDQFRSMVWQEKGPLTEAPISSHPAPSRSASQSTADSAVPAVQPDSAAMFVSDAL